MAGYQPDLARGEAIYADACAACHGANLEGEPNWRSPGPDGRLPAPPYDASGHMLTDAGRLVCASLWEDLDAIKQRFGEDWQASFLPEGYGEMIEEHSIRHIDLSGGWFVDDQASREPGRDLDGSS